METVGSDEDGERVDIFVAEEERQRVLAHSGTVDPDGILIGPSLPTSLADAATVIIPDVQVLLFHLHLPFLILPQQTEMQLASLSSHEHLHLVPYHLYFPIITIFTTHVIEIHQVLLLQSVKLH